MRGYNFDTLEYTLTTLNMLAGSLKNLGTNSGLPEMVRNDLRLAGENLGSNVSAVMSFRTAAIMAGFGPVSTGLRASAEWLGVIPGEKNLDNLTVFQPHKPEGASVNDKYERWSQLFITKFPRDMFDPVEGTVEIKTRYCDYDITITARLTHDKKYASDPTTHIEEISFVITTAEKFWTITGEMTRSGSLFLQHPFENRSWNIVHHVEDAHVSIGPCTGDNYTWFVDHCLISPLAEHLGQVFTPLGFPPRAGYPGALESTFDVKVRKLPSVHRSDAYDLLLHWLGRSPDKAINVEQLEGVVIKLGRGDSDWYSFETVTNARNKYHWNYDKPIVKITSIELDGLDLSRRFLPDEWRDIITEQISKTFDELLATREWPEPDVETEPSQ